MRFALDEFPFEPAITPVVLTKQGVDPLARVRAKLSASKPITVVTMDDSLTDRRHWANRETSWTSVMRELVSQKYMSDLRVVNPAIGGTALCSVQNGLPTPGKLIS